MPSARRLAAWRAAGLALAAVGTLTGLGLIWGARLAATRFVYVSELGAAGEPTAEVFRWGLSLVAVSAALTALGAPRLHPGQRPRARWLAALPPAAVLAGSAAAFGVASQVTCTIGCPLPVGPAFTWQDLIHTVCAVIGFAGAAYVMLQVATDRDLRGLARYSAVSAVVVAVIAGVGGLLSLLRFLTDLGGILELIATTVALLWLAVLAGVLAAHQLRRARMLPVDQAQPSVRATEARVAAR